MFPEEIKLECVYKWTTRVVCVVAVILSVFSIIHLDIVRNGYKDLQITEVSQDMEIKYNDAEITVQELPFAVQGDAGDVISCNFHLDRDLFEKGRGLFFRGSHQKIRVYADGELIYEYGYRDDQLIGSTPGSKWATVDLESVHKYMDITIELESVYDSYELVVPTIHIGTFEGINHYFLSNLGYVFIELGLLLIGITFLVIGIAFNFRKMQGVRFGYAGFVMIFMSLWLIFENRQAQFFIDNPILVVQIVFLVFPLLPVVVCGFLMTHKDFQNSRNAKVVYFLAVLNFISIQILQIFGIRDYVNTNNFTLIVDLLVFLEILVTFINKCRSNNIKSIKNTEVYMAIIGFALFGGIDVTRYLLGQGGYNLIKYTQIGFVLYVVLLAAWSIKASFYESQLSVERKTYEKLAYIDLMTDLPNRSAFEKKMDKCREKKASPIIAVMDINGLKGINDTYGHKLGDDAILKVAGILKDYVSDTFVAFRIGGDEFCVFEEEMELDEFCKVVSEIDIRIEEAEKDIIYPLSVSVGISKAKSGNVDETFSQADRNMYARKTEHYKKYGIERRKN